jgi:hypothetical protein
VTINNSLCSRLIAIVRNRRRDYDESRVAMNVHPRARDSVREYLLSKTNGEGYTEFMLIALELRKSLDDAIEDLP